MVHQIFSDLQKRILILGFGKEGSSTYKFLRSQYPERKIGIADKDDEIYTNHPELWSDPHLTIYHGTNYLESIRHHDIIIRSPGINLPIIAGISGPGKTITSQTELFLKEYGSQTIGVTGTKGKSSTTSMIHHILKMNGTETLLAGNIGIPPFDLIDKIKENTQIVYELSAHQLDGIQYNPHIIVILNLYEEHLDFFRTKERYWNAKLSVLEIMTNTDLAVINHDNEILVRNILSRNYLPKILWYSSKALNHADFAIWQESNSIIYKSRNEYRSFHHSPRNKDADKTYHASNILAVMAVGLELNILPDQIFTALQSYIPLEHRLEFVGEFEDVIYYNDSIATVPEATICAIESLKYVDTLILGGFDRGINYQDFANYLTKSAVRNILLTGTAGQRIFNLLDSEKHCFMHIELFNRFSDAVIKAMAITAKKRICLLSPAASSYNEFRNFEERGNLFKSIVSNSNHRNKET